MINNFLKNITSNRIYVILYLIVVLYFVIITYRHHKNEEIKNAESFIGEVKYLIQALNIQNVGRNVI